MIIKMVTKFKVCTPKPGRCRYVHARGFAAGQKNCGKSGLGHPAAGGRGPWAARPSGRRAAGPRTCF